MNFLVHAVDVEGKASGIEVPLAEMLGDWGRIQLHMPEESAVLKI